MHLYFLSFYANDMVHFLLMLDKYLFKSWGRVTYICISNLTIIGSDNGLSPGQHQTII